MKSSSHPFHSDLGMELTRAELELVSGGFRPAHDVGEAITASGKVLRHAVHDVADGVGNAVSHKVNQVKKVVREVVHFIDLIF